LRTLARTATKTHPSDFALHKNMTRQPQDDILNGSSPSSLNEKTIEGVQPGGVHNVQDDKNGETTESATETNDYYPFSTSTSNQSKSETNTDEESTNISDDQFLVQGNQQQMEEQTFEDGYEGDGSLDLKTVKLFVGQIPYSYSEENLFPLFSQFGEVAEIVVIRDRFTFKSRGCAFVSFRERDAADVCIRELNQRLKLPPVSIVFITW